MGEEPRTWRVTHHAMLGVVYTEPMRTVLLHKERVIAEDLTQREADALVALIKAEDGGHE